MSIKQLIPEIRALMQDGFYIFPVHITTHSPTKGKVEVIKKPAVTGYLKLQIDDVDKMIKLFEKVGANAIGMAPALNGLVVLDVDSYKPECNFIDLQGLDTASLDTLTVETGRGGRHYYFDAAEGVRYKGKIEGIEAVDIKHRGFVVMPPSNGYKWISEKDILPAPDWLPTRGAKEEKPSNLLADLDTPYELTDRLIKLMGTKANEIHDYPEWFEVASGMHYDFYGTQFQEAAFDALIAWTLRYEGDKPDDVVAKEAENIWNGMTDQFIDNGNKQKPKKESYTGASVQRQLALQKDWHEKIELPPIIEGLDWITDDLPLPEWLVEGFLETDEIMGISGTSNAGKTRFLCMLVAALSAGRPDVIGITDTERDPIRCMMVSNEENEIRLKRRLKAAILMNDLQVKESITFAGQGWLDDRPATTLLHVDPKGNVTVNESVVDAIIERALEAGTQLITFDPYVTLGVANENTQADNNEMFAVFRRIAQETGAAIVFIHHAGKGESRNEAPDMVRGMMSAFRGSSVITSSMDSGFSLLPYVAPALKAGKNKVAGFADLAEKIKAGLIPNYIALDWVKRRDAKMSAARYYVIEGYAMPEGNEVAGMRLVTEEEAMLTQTSGVGIIEKATSTLSKAAKMAAQMDMGEVARIIAANFREGATLSLTAMHTLLRGNVAGWPDGDRTPANDQPAVAYVLERLQNNEFSTGKGTTVTIVDKGIPRGPNSGYIVRINAETLEN